MDRDDLLSLYRKMLLIRRFEEKSAEMYALAKIGGFLHLYIGEEAIAVGAIAAIRADDYVITAYRDHGHCLAKGSEPGRVMAELFGKATGLCKGKGGSMHLVAMPSWEGTFRWPQGWPSPSSTRSATRWSCASSEKARCPPGRRTRP